MKVNLLRDILLGHCLIIMNGHLANIIDLDLTMLISITLNEFQKNLIMNSQSI